MKGASGNVGVGGHPLRNGPQMGLHIYDRGFRFPNPAAILEIRERVESFKLIGKRTLHEVTDDFIFSFKIFFLESVNVRR
jgi:hypothetical protein